MLRIICMTYDFLWMPICLQILSWSWSVLKNPGGLRSCPVGTPSCVWNAACKVGVELITTCLLKDRAFVGTKYVWCSSRKMVDLWYVLKTLQTWIGWLFQEPAEKTGASGWAQSRRLQGGKIQTTTNKDVKKKKKQLSEVTGQVV